MLTFENFATANRERCEQHFHSIDDWLPWEWSNAMAGEVGEACNLTKKMARVWPSNKLIQKWDDKTLGDLQFELGAEIGDVVIYADLLAQRLGFTLEDCVRRAFNEKSKKLSSKIQI